MLRNIIACVFCSLSLAIITVAEVSDTGDGTQPVQNAVTPKLNVSKLEKSIQEKYGVLRVDPITIPGVDESAQMLQKMCEANGANDSYGGAQAALRNLGQCFSDIGVFSQLPKQIEEARPNGNLDEVFRGSCRHVDEYKSCVHKLLLAIDPCLAVPQKSTKYTIQNITESILNFACENEGDYIALFISEKGPQCISSKQAGIERCIKKSMNGSKPDELYEEMRRLHNGTGSEQILADKESEADMSLNLNLEQCRKAYQMRSCIIEELKTCPGSTPANVVETIFNLAQRSTTCANYTRAELDPSYNGAASSMFASIFSIVIPAVTVLLARNLSS